ncbi:ATP-binding protein [Neobacillus niacini]|uniref:ATP-binding protein n=1 Tax=Neobacillus niacini TaxID=86668 RepID=UPI002FFDF22E
MGLFRSSDSGKVKNIKTKKLTKVFNVKEHKVQIDYLHAQYGEVEGHEILLDQDIIQETTKEVLKVFMNRETKYNPVPSHIIVSHQLNEKGEEEEKTKENTFSLSTAEPRYLLDQVFLPTHSRKQILTALTIEKYSDKLRNEWGLGSIVKEGRAVILNFFGPPGTGKSMTAEAIASHLGKKVMTVNYAELESKYVGETPKNITKCFAEATEMGAILIFDEADSFLGKRLTNVSQSADYGVNVTRSVMLMELERFSGIVIFTTNLISNYDQAFKRRIFANVEFTLPDQKGKERIWETHLPASLPLEKGITARLLSEKFDGVSGADIKDIVLYASITCLERDGEIIYLEDFEEAYSYIRSRYVDGKNITVKTEVISEEQYKKEMNLC